MGVSILFTVVQIIIIIHSLSNIGKTKLAGIAEYVQNQTMQLKSTIDSEDKYLSTVGCEVPCSD